MNHILIVKIGAIGDVVMALPLLPYLKKKYPEAKISWLCGASVAGILQETGMVDTLVVVNEKSLINGSAPEKVSAILKAWKQTAFQRYDLVVYGYFADAYRILFLPAFVGKMHRFSRKQQDRIIPIPGRHHSFEYLRLAAGTDTAENFVAEYPPFRYLHADHARILQNPGPGIRILFACGGARNLLRDDLLRRWPIEQYVKLTRILLAKGYEVVLTGGPDDKWILPYFQELSITDMVGQLGLLDYISFMKTGDCMVTHDSGPLHLADLANLPSVSVFGPTNPWEKASLLPASTFIWGGENLTCRPCYDGRNYANCQNPVCLEMVSAELVALKVEEVLAAKSTMHK